MSSRIEVELTSQRPDGLWTWRAAGAKEPRGTLDGSILYEGAKIGDVVRAEVAFEIDGIYVESVHAPKPKHTQSNVIELASREPQSYVTRTVTGRERRGGGDRRSPRSPRRQARAGQPDSRTPLRRTDNRAASQGAGEKRAPQRRGERPGKLGQPAKAPAPRYKKLTPKNTHRSEVLKEIAPEHLPIAEQLLKGGLPAVRQALASQNEKAIAEGKPTVPEATVLAIAEPMLPLLKLATWKDRAEVAIEIASEASLRDLRSVISAADLIRHDDATRELLENLKQLTEQRAEVLRTTWLDDIRENLTANRVIRAVRLSSRPPEPIAKLPSELLEELTKAVNEMLGPDTPSDRWAALLDVVSQSPIRRQVEPTGLPENAPAELIERAKESSGRIPSLARLLGIAIPPPPRPRKKIMPTPEPPQDHSEDEGVISTQVSAESGSASDTQETGAAPESPQDTGAERAEDHSGPS